MSLLDLLKREDKRLIERFEFLKSLLEDKEVIVIESKGPSKALINIAMERKASFSLYDSTTYGSLAGLAEKELKEFYHLPNLSLGMRSEVGKILDIDYKETKNLQESLRRVKKVSVNYDNKVKTVPASGIRGTENLHWKKVLA
jgi:hypothetical protein